MGEGAVDGVALDLGVSSMQLDEAERGFSFMRDGPLDMRMAATGLTAADLVNEAEPAELARIFRVYGEERQARRIAGALARRRAEQPFTRTLDLAEARRARPGRPAGREDPSGHPGLSRPCASRSTRSWPSSKPGWRRPSGRSGRAGGWPWSPSIRWKTGSSRAFLTARAGREGGGSRHAPPKAGGPAPSFRLLHTGARAPTAAEIAANPRARSAKLRAAMRTDAPAWRLAA